MALLTCNHTSFGYDNKIVLEDVDFAIDRGMYLCVVGENGAGKSTLIKSLLQLQPAIKGRVETGDGLKRENIGYMPQQTQVQRDFPASVMEIVLSGRLNALGWKPFYSKKDKVIARDNLDKMGMVSYENHCYHELSGGQQQRVLLARALCATQDLILLDEPVAGLDPVAMAELYQLIQHINQEMGITVIMVSHDIQAAVKDASHILHLANRQLFFGTKEEYLKSETGKLFLKRSNVNG